MMRTKRNALCAFKNCAEEAMAREAPSTEVKLLTYKAHCEI